MSADLGPGSTRPGYAHRELQLRSLDSGGAWGGTVYELRPGERICPYHWHAAEEEWLLVLSGAPTLRERDGEQVLRPWDVAVFRRGEEGAHEVRNDTEETLKVLMLATRWEPEICVYPDSGKVSAWHLAADGTLTGLRNRAENNIDYFDGEA
ncbi:MAG: hypothetical protein QOI27_1247 [Gaiellaceae bacterium]|nr:hypothetical protein [Gaiellaceae bacterium]MDX6474429.1 hypothetical protein [Gaiellaceae bacterium]